MLTSTVDSPRDLKPTQRPAGKEGMLQVAEAIFLSVKVATLLSDDVMPYRFHANVV